MVKKHPILASIFCIAIVIAVSTLANKYYEQQKTLNELSAVSKDLRVIYDKILASQEGNVTSSYFRNECSRSYTGFFVTRYSCGSQADITLNSEIGNVVASQIISESLQGNALDPKIPVDTHEQSIGLNLKSTNIRVKCYVSYGKEYRNNTWGYHMNCNENTSGPLPNYLDR